MSIKYFEAWTNRNSWRMCWETKKVMDPRKNKLRFVARLQKRGELWHWTTVKEKFYSARWRAKDQAWKWYCEKTKTTFYSLHTKSAGRVEAGKKLVKHMLKREKRKEAKKSGLKPVRRRKVLRRKSLKAETDTNGSV